ncbi:hypothetical protein [Hymenobacter glacialis]|uniref:hypothetical protein n=1 Tax=Hymenobacter glacialis TaxID=1908236 RepID=UPI0019D32194|nr:hypothetical protein [Hymenobacter glacialis]
MSDVLPNLHKLNKQPVLQPQAPSQLLNWLVASIVIGCALLTISILIWSLPRGFDITDESFYLLSYRYPDEYEASFSTFHLLIARGLGLVDCSVLTYRWLGVLANSLGAVAFAYSFARWERTVSPYTTRPTIITICYILLGSLLAFSIFPRTLSYNSLNTLLLLLAVGAVLQALSSGPKGRYWLLVAGVAVSLDVFVKPSTAFLIASSGMLLVIWSWQRHGIKVIVSAGVLLGLGVAAGLTFYFIRVQSPLVWYHNFVQETSVIKAHGGYGMRDLLLSYIKVAGQTILFMLYPMGPVLLLLLGLTWWWTRKSHLSINKPYPVVLALLVLAVVYTAWQAFTRQWYADSFSNGYQSLPLLLFLLILAVGILVVLPAVQVNTTHSKRPSQLVPVSIWLFSLPFLASLGTINDLRLNLLIDVGSWFALLLLISGIQARYLPVWIVSLLLLVPVGWAAGQIAWGTLINPYGLKQPMSKQTVPLRTAGFSTTLLVDSATATFFTQFTRLLTQNGFHPGDPMITLYDAPGLAYASGGISPGMGWYFSHRDVRNCHGLDVTKLAITKSYIVTTQPIGEIMQKCLNDKGVYFPEYYRLVGSLSSPHYSQVNIYAPIQAVP